MIRKYIEKELSIIDEDTFERVQELRKHRRRIT